MKKNLLIANQINLNPKALKMKMMTINKSMIMMMKIMKIIKRLNEILIVNPKNYTLSSFFLSLLLQFTSLTESLYKSYDVS